MLGYASQDVPVGSGGQRQKIPASTAPIAANVTIIVTSATNHLGLRASRAVPRFVAPGVGGGVMGRYPGARRLTTPTAGRSISAIGSAPTGAPNAA